MKPCELRDTYLDGGLMPLDASVFEKHLSQCRLCRERVDEWQTFQSGIQRWAETQKTNPVSMIEAEALIRLAEKRRHHDRTRRPLHFWGGLAAAGATVAVLFALFVSGPTNQSPITAPNTASQQTAAVLGLSDKPLIFEQGERVEAPVNTHINAAIGKDKVAVSSAGRIRLIDLDGRRVRLGLESGTVACRVDKRNGRGDFIVEAGHFAVRVVGTRFAVSRNRGDFEVLVQEGAVRVESRSGKSWMLRAGDALAQKKGGTPLVMKAPPTALEKMNDLFEAPLPSPAPVVNRLDEPEESNEDEIVPNTEDIATETNDALNTALHAPSESAESPHGKRPRPNQTANLPKWRKWVVEGETDQAEAAMKAYLRVHPQDHRVWALLGDASRKAKDWEDARRAYEQAIELGGEEAGRSMYMLAALLQSPLGQHQAALEMFRRYKASGQVSKKLAELTDVKIARSLVAMGRCEAARKSVSHLLTSNGSIVAKNAKKLVESCQDGRVGASE